MYAFYEETTQVQLILSTGYISSYYNLKQIDDTAAPGPTFDILTCLVKIPKDQTNDLVNACWTAAGTQDQINDDQSMEFSFNQLFIFPALIMDNALS